MTAAGHQQPNRGVLLQRTFAIWTFALRFVFKYWMLGRKFTYGKQVLRTKSLHLPGCRGSSGSLSNFEQPQRRACHSAGQQMRMRNACWLPF